MNWHIYHVESGTFIGEYEAVDDREAMALFLASDTDSVLTARTYTRSTAGAEGNVAG